LQNQNLPSTQYETIVVDDGSTDDTLSCLEALTAIGKGNISFRSQKNKGPGAARNLGMSTAKAPIFAFTDTDCRPSADWLAQIIKPFSDQNVGAVGGAEMPHAEDPILLQVIHFCMTSPFTTGGLRGKKGKKMARYYPRTFNMAISREAFIKTVPCVIMIGPKYITEEGVIFRSFFFSF
jgi:glycosyltransferase involved in cell wall biosynthesis